MKTIKSTALLRTMLAPYVVNVEYVINSQFRIKTAYKAFKYLTELAESYRTTESRQIRERQFFHLTKNT